MEDSEEINTPPYGLGERKPQDDPKFRALLMRREQGCTVPERLWADGEVAPLDGIISINEMHRKGRITGREWLRYVREWMENIARHHGTVEDIERVKKVAKPSRWKEGRYERGQQTTDGRD